MSCISPVRSWVKCSPPPPPAPPLLAPSQRGRQSTGTLWSIRPRPADSPPRGPTHGPRAQPAVPPDPSWRTAPPDRFWAATNRPYQFFSQHQPGAERGQGKGYQRSDVVCHSLAPPPPPSPTLDSALAETEMQPRVTTVAAQAQLGSTTRTKLAVPPLCSTCSPYRCHRSPCVSTSSTCCWNLLPTGRPF